jgi:hypothetical protein
MNLFKCILFFILLLSISFFACQKDELPTQFKTEKVIILVMDGARYSETLGDPTRSYIPRLTNDLSPRGVINTNFYNNGRTKTISGHSALATGHYDFLENTGQESPNHPSIFQLWRAANHKDSTDAWLVTSKAKLEVLSNSADSVWRDSYRPSHNCGKDGLGSNYRLDDETFVIAKEVLSTQKPELMLVNFIEPDLSGHQNDWEAYLAGTVQTDEYIYQLWDFIETDSFYKGTTTVFVTNDHGRHLDGINDGFKSHGDDCEGCRHIFLYAFGPDFKEGAVTYVHRELPDIAVTTGRLLGFEIPGSEGKVMRELFK